MIAHGIIVAVTTLFLLALLFGVGLLFLWENRKRLLATIEQKEEEYKKLFNQKKSSEVRLGQISESLAPFLANFKYDPKRAHFLGMPIDYIIFEDDRVVFLEVKSGQAQLNPTQKSIKTLIENKKVTWDEMRIDGKEQITNNSVGESIGVSTAPDVQSAESTKSEMLGMSVSVSGTQTS